MDTNRQIPKKVIIGYSIVSPLHLINFLTYLKYENKQYDVVYIFLSVYWSKSIIPKRYLDFCSKRGCILVCKESEKNEILNNMSKDDDISIVFVKYLAWKLMFKGIAKINRIVVIDEGLSSYAGFAHSIKAQFRESKSIVKTLKFIISWCLGSIAKMLYINRFIKFTAFDLKKNEIVSSYKNNFCLILNDLKEKNNTSENCNTILFCTQPWVDLGVMSCEQYNQYLMGIKDSLIRNHMNLVIKKHPADIAFNYSDFSVIEFDGVVEELVCSENYLGVLSACSTSSLLIPACFNIDSYTVDTSFIGKIDPCVARLFQKYSKNIDQLF